MTHNHKRGDVWREAQLGLFTGFVYGGTHTLVGHPLDTIKSKMQIQSGFTSKTAMEVAKITFQREGIIGFFHGCIPPLWGSMVYRGIMISCNEYAFTWLEKHTPEDGFFRTESAFGLRPMVPAAALFSSFMRTFVESPVEYAKVMGQTGKKWQLRDIYRGYPIQIARTITNVVPIFSILDCIRRKTTLMETSVGHFIAAFGATAVTFTTIWPLETLKNLAQTGTPFVGATLKQRLDYLGGPLGLYRGALPGISANCLRNGVSMVAMMHAQEWATKLGLRD